MHHGSSAAAAKHGHESLMAAWCDKEADRDVTQRDLVFWESHYCLFSSFGTLICFASVALQGGAEVPTYAEVIFNDNLPIINQWRLNWVRGRKVVRSVQWGDEKRDPFGGGREIWDRNLAWTASNLRTFWFKTRIYECFHHLKLIICQRSLQW